MACKQAVPAMVMILVLSITCLSGINVSAQEQDDIRIATYNIKYLDANKIGDQGDRESKLEDVIRLFDADIIALQEIDDRQALRRIFRTQDWHLVIDDDSGNNQDVALAVRKPRAVYGFSGTTLDADDEHFLFPDSGDNTMFPNRRDVLCVGVEIPNDTLWIMVIHAKSRYGGRATTDARREAAARALVQMIEDRFDERQFVLLGDFNDNPDDRSMNILETGDPDAQGGEENTPGAFLVNITEVLLLSDHVSHGRNTSNINGDLIDTSDQGSRARNNDGRGTNVNTGDILFDQILIPPRMLDSYIQGSVMVFNREVAARGNDNTRASDHLPVFADFVFETGEDPEAPEILVRIAALLPNPEGRDAGNESITIENIGTQAVDITGWTVVDLAGNTVSLSGTIAAGATREFVFTGVRAILNNDGDEVSLVSSSGIIMDTVTYARGQVSSGQHVTF